MHICFFVKLLLLSFWLYFWHISLIQQSKNVSENYHLLDVDRKNVTRNTGLLFSRSPVSLDKFKDLINIPLYRQFVNSSVWFLSSGLIKG